MNKAYGWAIWLTGLPASGKTTLRAIRGVCIARRLRARYKDAIPKGTKY